MGEGGSQADGEIAVGLSDLASLCHLLNEGGVRYLVYGGLACIIHGHTRTTMDADICVGEDRDNITRALAVLARWGEGFAGELTPDDVLENVVVRIGEKITVDLSCRLWKVDWNHAWNNRRLVTVAGVIVPVLCRLDLYRSKETYRERDRWDRDVLSGLTHPEPGRPADV